MAACIIDNINPVNVEKIERYEYNLIYFYLKFSRDLIINYIAFNRFI